MSAFDPLDTLSRSRPQRTFLLANRGAVLRLLSIAAALSAPSLPAALHAQAAPVGVAPVVVSPVSAAPVVVQPGAPGTPSRILPPSTRASTPPHSPADTAFMQGMIMHHSQAVEMTALIASHTTNPAVHSIGDRIRLSQTDEIKFMRTWLESRGEATSMSMPGMPDMDMSGQPMPSMPGMLTPPQMAALRQAHGAHFDRLFLSGMVQHHGGALTMVKDLFDSAGAGQDADLFNFATDVDNTQRAEIRIMQAMLQHPAPQSAAPTVQETR